MPYSTVHFSCKPYSTVHYSCKHAIQYSTHASMPYSTLLMQACHTVHYSCKLPYSTLLMQACRTVQYITHTVNTHVSTHQTEFFSCKMNIPQSVLRVATDGRRLEVATLRDSERRYLHTQETSTPTLRNTMKCEWQCCSYKLTFLPPIY